MSLTIALGSAFNGLKAGQSQFAILSRNVENAASPNYVRKDAVLTSRLVAGTYVGLQVSVMRDVDERLVRDFRQQTADNAALATKSEYLAVWATKIGQPQDESSVSSTLNAFKVTMQALEGNPGSQVDQLNVLRAAERLAGHVSGLDRQAHAMVADVDAQIRARVDGINASLRQVEALNKQIAGRTVGSVDTGDLMDQRDRIADSIASEMGISTYIKENGEMVILARGGATLLDSKATVLEHSAFGNLVTGDGTVLTPSSGNPSGLRAGNLGALFELRDKVIPGFRSQLDGMASALVRMFEEADETLAPGQAGLFTDAGTAYDPANVSGLAGRLSVNDAVRPSAGGDLWKLSSGMGAPEAIPGGDSTQVTAFLDAFTSQMSFPGAGSLPGSATVEDFAVSMVSFQQSERVAAQSGYRVSSVMLSTLHETRMNRDGVNVDDELMKISLVERSYQASSAVVKAVQDMLDVLIAST